MLCQSGLGTHDEVWPTLSRYWEETRLVEPCYDSGVKNSTGKKILL